MSGDDTDWHQRYRDRLEHGIPDSGGEYPLGDAVERFAAEAADLSDRGAWDPVDLAALKDRPRLRPIIGSPAGATLGLLYPGRKHWIFGPTGCGKSWAALYCADHTARTSRRVLWIDMEDVAAAFADRLRTIAGHAGYRNVDGYMRAFDYIEKPWEQATATRLAELVAPDRGIGLVVLDGITDYAHLNRWDLDSNNDAAMLGKHLDVLASTGAAVLMLDASAKGSDLLYPIGAQHKLAQVDGSAYLLKPNDPFSRSTSGSSVLLVAKDRPGGLPAGHGQQAATLMYSPATGFSLHGTGPGWKS